jgi:peptide/nickel transport system permease protein
VTASYAYFETPPTATRPDTVWRAIWGSSEGRLGLTVGGMSLFVVLFGRFLAPYPPKAFLVGAPALGPTGAHLLGTDASGRDVLSRLLAGGTTVLIIPLAAVLLSMAVGGTLGLACAYVGGWLDRVVARLFDLMLTLPPLLVVLVVIAGFGTARSTLVITTALVFAPAAGRVMRGATQSVVVTNYVRLARARGERGHSIIAREILPNVVGPLLVELGIQLTYGILFISALSFLGLGVQPPNADWGLMVAEDRSLLAVAPLTVVAPALAITCLALGFNLVADAIASHLIREQPGEVMGV